MQLGEEETGPPTNLRQSPGLRQEFRNTSVAMAMALGALLVLTTLAGWLVWRRVRAYEGEAGNRTAAFAASAVRDRFTHLSALVESLASNVDFQRPDDAAIDALRMELATQHQARELALQYGTSTWLATENGPVLPLSDLHANSPVLIWQLAHGLPIRSSKGKFAAKTRRLLAAQAMAIDRNVLGVAELDEAGRVVFFAPYSSQLQLSAFNLSQTYRLQPSDLGASQPRVVLHLSPFADKHNATELSLVSVVQRPNRPLHYLVLTVNKDFSEQGASASGFTLVDDSRAVVAYSGAPASQPQTDSARRGTDVTALAMSINSGLYWLLVPSPSSPAATSISMATGFYMLGTLLAFLYFDVFLLKRAFLWTARLQWKLDTVERDVQRTVRDLAHDFQNGIFSLRNVLGNISGKLSLGELQRLGSAINDLGGYTDHLSANLVPEAFALAGVPGGVAEDRREKGTYLLGALEGVVQQHSPTPQNRVPVEFSNCDSGLFVAMSRADLSRIVSNLLVNAIEACGHPDANSTRVGVLTDGDDVCVRVSDNGGGIPEAIRRQIFTPGFTTKGEARGKGLASCRELAKRWAASVTLHSTEVGQGTVMELRVRRSPTPPWFVNSIRLTGKSVLVVVDDENEAFHYWEKAIAQRFSDIQLQPDQTPTLLSISSPSELRQNKYDALSRGTIFLVDYKFKTDSATGIDLILELNLADKTILVTNYFDQEDVLDAVSRLGLRLLPKTYMLNAKFPIELGVEE